MELQPREVLPKEGFTIYTVTHEGNDVLVDYILADTALGKFTANPYHPLETLDHLSQRRWETNKIHLMVALPTLIPMVDGIRRGIEGDIFGNFVEMAAGITLTLLVYSHWLKAEDKINAISKYILKQMEQANVRQLMEAYASDKDITSPQEPASEVS